MAIKQYGSVLNTLNIKAKNIFNWNVNYYNKYGRVNFNSQSAHTYITRRLSVSTSSGTLTGYLPSVKNIDFDTASTILRNSGFTPLPSYIYTNDTAIQQYASQGGYVVTQSPAPSASSGQLVQFGTSVLLDVLLYTSVPIVTTTAPNAPLWSNATSADSAVTLTFVTPATGGSPILRYEYSIDNGANWTSVGLPVNNTFTVSSLTNNIAYTFYIRAVNAVGNSASSAPVVKSPTSGSGGGTVTTPGAPTFTVSFITNTSFRINLTAPTNIGGAEIIRYQHSLDNGLSWTNDFTNIGPITVSSLSPGRTYQVTIRAVNSAGNGAAATTQSISTTQIVPDLVGLALNTAKTIITASGYVYGEGTANASNNQYYLGFSGGLVNAQSPVQGSTLSGGSTIRLDYTVYLAAPSYGTVPNVIGLSFSDAITRIQQAGYSNITQITTSDANKTYGVIYAQTPSAGTASLVNQEVTITYSNYTGSLSIPTNQVAPTATGDNLYVGAKFNVVPGTWTDSPTSYLYQWIDGNGINYANATGASYTVNSTAISRSIRFKLAAINAAGTSSYVNSSNIFGPIKDLSKPTDIQYAPTGSRTSSSISVVWSGGDSPFYFVGIYKPGTSSYVSTKIVTTESTSFSGLTAGTNYYVQIFGNNNNEYTADSKTSGVLSTSFSAAPVVPVLNSTSPGPAGVNFSLTRGANSSSVRVYLENVGGGTVAGTTYVEVGVDQTQSTITGFFDSAGLANRQYRLAAYGYNEDYGLSATSSSALVTTGGVA
jgi:beta-lactam-binding protein with PASTA domain